MYLQEAHFHREMGGTDDDCIEIQKRQCAHYSVDDVAAIGLTSFLLAAVILALLSIVFSEQIVVLTGARNSLARLIKPAAGYLSGYCIGLPFYTATIVLSPYLQMDGDYNRVTLSSVVMTIVDMQAGEICAGLALCDFCTETY